MKYYFGQLEKKRNNNKLAYVNVLAEISKGESSSWRIDSTALYRFGPRKRVFVLCWKEDILLGLNDGDYVRFTCEQNPDYDGDPKHDEFMIKPDDREYDHELSLQEGVRIIREGELDGHWRDKPRFTGNTHRDNERVFVHIKLDGEPFLLDGFSLKNNEGQTILSPPATKTSVTCWPKDSIDTSKIINNGTESFLLSRPIDNELAKELDIQDNNQLKNWLKKKFKKVTDFSAILESSGEGLTKFLEQVLVDINEGKNSGDLESQRWARVHEKFQAFDISVEEIKELIKCPNWREVFDDYMDSHVESFKDEIELKTSKLSSVYEELKSKSHQFDEDLKLRIENSSKVLDKELSVKRSLLEEQESSLGAEVEDLEKRKQKLESQLLKKQGDVDKLEGRFTEAIERFNSSRNELIEDFSLFQSLLGSTLTAPETIGVKAPSTFTAVTPLPLLPDKEKKIVEGLDIKSLHTSLVNWGISKGGGYAKLLYIGAKSCKALIIPNGSWSCAYRDWIGKSCQLEFLGVDPSWTRFSEAWAELSSFWIKAINNPDYTFILHIQDFDMALVESWARPILNILAGFTDSLKVKGELYIWPENLKLFVSVSPDQENSLGLSIEVTSHFAAIAVHDNELEVEVEHWPTPSLTHVVDRDCDAIKKVTINFGVDEFNCDTYADKLRVHGPKSYVIEPSNA